MQSGEILIDGFDIEQYNVHYLRRSIGYIMQEPILFNMTIKENIKYGKPEATDEEVYKAAMNSNLLEYIESISYEHSTNSSQEDPIEK